MKINKTFDIILNVFFPLFSGCFFYYAARVNFLSPELKSYLPDGFWAYSFISAVLIIWQRHINWFWVLVVLLISAITELLQHIQWMDGSGDVFDVLTYTAFIGAGLLVNKGFKKIYVPNNNYEIDE